MSIKLLQGKNHMRFIKLSVLVFLLSGCSTYKAYDGENLASDKLVHVKGMSALDVSAGGLTAKVCQIDDKVLNPCEPFVEFLPGKRTLILESSYMGRTEKRVTINQDFKANDQFLLGIKFESDGRAPVLIPRNNGSPQPSMSNKIQGSIEGNKYTSPRKWFSVQIPQPVSTTSINDGGLSDANQDFEVVWFSQIDSGNNLVAGIDYFPDDFINKKIKGDDPRNVLHNLSAMALGFGRDREQLKVMSSVIDEKYISTKHGEALMSVYLLKKGATLSQKNGSSKPSQFDTLVATIVTLEKNNFIYVIAQNDQENQNIGNASEEKLKNKAQLFFETIEVHH